MMRPRRLGDQRAKHKACGPGGQLVHREAVDADRGVVQVELHAQKASWPR